MRYCLTTRRRAVRRNKRGWRRFKERVFAENANGRVSRHAKKRTRRTRVEPERVSKPKCRRHNGVGGDNLPNTSTRGRYRRSSAPLAATGTRGSTLCRRRVIRDRTKCRNTNETRGPLWVYQTAMKVSRPCLHRVCSACVYVANSNARGMRAAINVRFERDRGRATWNDQSPFNGERSRTIRDRSPAIMCRRDRIKRPGLAAP